MLGKSFQVKFVTHNHDLRGENPEFQKIAFIAKRYAGAHPLNGEEWMCRVVGDSKPDNPARGALFLLPLERLSPKDKWEFDTAVTADNITVTASCISMLGKRELRRRSWQFSNEQEIRSFLPTRYERNIAAEFKAAKEEQCKQKKLRDAHEQKLLAQTLTNAAFITITAVSTIEHSLTVEAKQDYYRNHVVLVDGKKVGLFDSWGPLELNLFPLTVRGRLLTLSNGEAVAVYSHNLQIIEKWALQGYKWKAKKKLIFSDLVQLKGVGEAKLTWSRAENLAVGDTVANEFPFQWAGNWLTNGIVWFPRQRPEASQWHEYPVSAVPKDCWELFLSGLAGKFLQELIPFHTELSNRREIAKQASPTERQQKLQSLLSGQMWQGKAGCTRVSVGRNVVFHVKLPSGNSLYVVDNPGVGAIYLFSNLSEANDLASGAITRRKAIENGCKRLIHSKGWQKKLTELLIA